jgi:1,2-phenylacetyl-CoA epoxidase PaaB subunit
MTIETSDAADLDHKVTEAVEASDERYALNKARELVRFAHPEINPAKIWAWTIERKLS